LTVNLSGAGDFDIRKAGAGKLTVDGSEMTGALTVTSVANMLTITGGAGDDTFTATTALKSVLDGGAGTDTLKMTGGTDLTAATFKNFEILDGNMTVLSSALNGLNITVDDTNNSTLSLSTADVDTNTIDLSGINFLDTVGDGVDMQTTPATQDTAKIIGGSAMTITGSNGADKLLGFGGADTITGGKGVDDLDGGAGDDTLDGGDGIDTITGGAGDDTMTGGKGADIFEIGATGASTVMSASNDASVANGVFTGAATVAKDDVFTFGNGVDVVTDFGTTDTIQATTANAITSTLTATNAALVDNTNYIIYGTWDGAAKTFTVATAFDATTANDGLYVEGDGTLTALTTTGWAVLEDLSAAVEAAQIV
jgi:Ca2+-binding RTX toxin-like protein